GGPLASQLVEHFAAQAQEYLAQGEATGMITPSRDPAARARVPTEMALRSLLLQLPAQRAPLDLDGRPGWVHGYPGAIALPTLATQQHLLTLPTLLTLPSRPWWSATSPRPSAPPAPWTASASPFPAGRSPASWARTAPGSPPPSGSCSACCAPPPGMPRCSA